MNFTIPLLSRVRHTTRTRNQDEWTGVVVERSITEHPSGSLVKYAVRWIKPCGDPSDGLTNHAAEELQIIEPG